MKFQDRHMEWRHFAGHRDISHFEGTFIKHRHGGSRGDHRGGRGEGRHRFFGRGEFKFALLELLISEPMHGYQLIKAMEEKTGGLYVPSAGSVYPNLQLLEDMKLITSTDTDGKKLYHITEEGIAVLAERKIGQDQPGGHWEERKRHLRPDKEVGRHHLRGLMKEQPDLLFLMAGAVKEIKLNPESAQSLQIKELLGQFESRLSELLGAQPNTHREDEAAGSNIIVSDSDLATDKGMDQSQE
ncbi:PadR family transcriptional regulator [Paenibacillus provencensis]|uniref:PadR family transcriptional regulator n=1 Tax=Paenibacillus provencensis TaxID=441151 RepID=A0ABW3PVK5_9BACL|nr:PadR family transcriptional regulator [Paenibacillus sp. MER 78]MCM3129700.1 PadR family transcriptional regulator [Paenibacillus sp. MER 78]